MKNNKTVREGELERRVYLLLLVAVEVFLLTFVVIQGEINNNYYDNLVQEMAKHYEENPPLQMYNYTWHENIPSKTSQTKQINEGR